MSWEEGRCLEEGDVGEGLEVGRKCSKGSAQGSNPTCQGMVLEETCPGHAIPAKGSWSF